MLKPSEVADDIVFEYNTARSMHRAMASTHEGYAVIKEELDELWDEIRKKHPSKALMRREAVQVGAMALAFIREVCDGPD